MAKSTSIIELVFGHDTQPPPCSVCSGVGLRCVEPDEDVRLCEHCDGSGFGNVLDPDPIGDPRQLRLRLEPGDELVPDDGDDDDFLIVDPNALARYRRPMTEAEMDEAAAEFGAALLRGLDEFEND